MAKPAPLDLVLNIRQSLHDLAQPLAAVTGLVDLLLLEMAANRPQAARTCRRISEQLERVLEIVGEIRRMLREASGAEPHQAGACGSSGTIEALLAGRWPPGLDKLWRPGLPAQAGVRQIRRLGNFLALICQKIDGDCRLTSR